MFDSAGISGKDFGVWTLEGYLLWWCRFKGSIWSMWKTCVVRKKPVDRVYDSSGILIQGKSIMHTKMFDEGQPFEGEA